MCEVLHVIFIFLQFGKFGSALLLVNHTCLHSVARDTKILESRRVELRAEIRGSLKGGRVRPVATERLDEYTADIVESAERGV
jgi:hypothetical protein